VGFVLGMIGLAMILSVRTGARQDRQADRELRGRFPTGHCAFSTLSLRA